MRWKASIGCRTDSGGAQPQQLPGRVSIDKRFAIRGQPDSGSVVVRDDCSDLVPYGRIAKGLAH